MTHPLPVTKACLSRDDLDRVTSRLHHQASGFNATARVILQAMKEYGMFLADNGSDWYVSGETNTTWNDDDLSQLKRVTGNAFEVVKMGKIVR